MNQQDSVRYGDLLERARDGLLSQIEAQRDGLGGRVEAAEAHFSHPQDSHAQLISEKDIEFAVGEQYAAELNAIESALGRVGAGTYGQCMACGHEIAPVRLQASPQAERCMPCQISYEKTH